MKSLAIRTTVMLLMSLIALYSFTQSPTQWKIKSEKLNGSQYSITLTASLQRGWYVYANADSANGLDALSIQTADSIKLQSQSSTRTISDPIFNSQQKVFTDGITVQATISTSRSTLPISIHGYASDRTSFLSIDTTLTVLLNGNAASQAFQIKRSIDINHPVSSTGDTTSGEEGLLKIFFLGLLGGIFALITPCVFPMIPVTVSFFMNRSRSKKIAISNGLSYGLFIFIIYLAASLPFHLVKGIDKNIFNSISTNPYVNIGFFIIFIVFALSFFGLFGIGLPGSVATKADSKANIQSLGGIFFMALTLTIVSFSCTGVILGVLLANVASAGAMGLTAGMAGFGFALALPFTLFAIFPHWLKALPKSGGWLDTVKKVLAFIELAMAFKFLSNADLVQHWGILKREIFIAIWMIIALALAFFLFGAFNKKTSVSLQNADKKRKQKPLFQLALGFISLAFALYLLPGLLHGKENSITLLSGFAPPMSYSVYGKNNSANHIQPDVVNDYEAALKLAKEKNKPLLIDFTGWACVNCRKMEEQVWIDPDIAQMIRNKFILVSLYVDDRKSLPFDLQFTFITKEGHNKFIKAVGDKWAMFEAENFNQVTQPLYAILTPDERLVNNPIGYSSADNYKNWLKTSLSALGLHE